MAISSLKLAKRLVRVSALGPMEFHKVVLRPESQTPSQGSSNLSARYCT